MAVSKTAGETKAKGTSAPKKKAAPKPSAAKKEAPKKLSPKAAAAPKKAAAPKAAAPKKAAPKKAAGPKLSPTQETLLGKIAELTSGYVAEKKLDQKVVDALLKHKLVKKGKKDSATKSFTFLISLAGKKYLAGKAAAAPKA